MRMRLSRAGLVLAVFVVLALVSAGADYVAYRYLPPPAAGVKGYGFERLFARQLATYLAWALLTPLVVWLGRAVPFSRDRRAAPLAIHLGASVLVTAPYFAVWLVMDGVLTKGFQFRPPPSSIALQLYGFRTLVNMPIYWLVLAVAMSLHLYDEFRAKQVHAAELERSLAAAELQALRMKLQPHFLFNTLNTIGFLALEGDTSAVGSVVERLGTLLRSSIESDGRQVVTLDEELAVLDQYLAIEELRFKDRLQVIRSIDPETRRALVPSLILQPLVENSIKHGLGRRIGVSRIEIGSGREGERLRLAVRDDGPGLPAGWCLSTGCGHGLKNVVQRLEALYQGAYSFDLRPTEPGGVVAELQIPFQTGRTPGSPERPNTARQT